MKIILTILVTTLSYSSVAQSIDESKLIGTWVAFQVEIPESDIPEEQSQTINTLKDGFVNSTYTFHSDGKFNLKFQNGTPHIMKELKFINNTNWKLDQNNTHVSIGNPEDKFSLMGLYIFIEGSDIFFQIEESPFLMRMKKN